MGWWVLRGGSFVLVGLSEAALPHSLQEPRNPVGLVTVGLCCVVGRRVAYGSKINFCPSSGLRSVRYTKKMEK